ncbi:PQQ-like domain-containing protein [Paenibacillus sp. UNCCL117]|uniref:outer membrane protein assembly factor BamB family protein n=1 Tax=unclassified Paenibacillus TaxID=185978 RepID=UPI00088BEEC1|nr:MULTISPECIES: PQQ-binding-like beta-propeller repeat protein [unclassified Paenibacillus]SDC11032.1 PQQ-like domain-containing protein [Paenibacillus sp. cl123]SFW16503.1 PQQ-like domain-containing protein [Paenibacillus sp. UNCCL117]
MRKLIVSALLLTGLLAGCNNNNGTINSSSPVINQGKAIEGISNVAWTYKTDEKAAVSQPLVTQDTIYFGTDKTLYAVDTKSGTKKWTRPINVLPSVPALAGNTLIYNDKDGIHAVNADNGEEIWKYDYNQKAPPELKPKATIASPNRAFITEQTNGGITLKAVDIKTGKVSWEYGNAVPFVGLVLAEDKLYVPIDGVIRIIDEKNGKEIDSISTDAPISSLNVARDQLFFVDMGGKITAFDLKSKKQAWQYSNEAFEVPNAPTLTVLKDKVIASEVKSGLVVGIDAKAGKELWKIKMGDGKYRATLPWIITQPSALGETLYIGTWGGENDKAKGTPAYSDLIAIDGNKGTELWRQKVDDFIMYPPAFNNGQTIITNMYQSVTAYNEGKVTVQAAAVEPKPFVEASATNKPVPDEASTEDVEYELKDFEGNWKSDKQAFKIAFTDSDTGIITFYDQGEEKAIRFEYKKPVSEYNWVMLLVGADKKPISIRLSDKDTLGYADEKMRDSLKRQDETQTPSDSAKALISGFEGKWCDSFQALCFELKLTDVNKGMLDYYQERDPIKESFDITYMDEYRIDIKIEGSKLATISLSKDKMIMTYETDSLTEMMTRQE